MAHLSRLGVVGADVGTLVGSDSCDASGESAMTTDGESSMAQDFSEIDEVGLIKCTSHF